MNISSTMLTPARSACLSLHDALPIYSTGQFLASSARFLNAVDAEKFAPWLPSLIEGAISKDRERRYIGSLLEAIWGADYMERAQELQL